MFPLELGTPRTPTSQNTVIGAAATVLSSEGFSDIVITGGTVGRVIDLGIKDAENMARPWLLLHARPSTTT